MIATSGQIEYEASANLAIMLFEKATVKSFDVVRLHAATVLY